MITFIGKQRPKTWLGLENRKKISQIINDYFYLPFFLLIIFMVSPIQVTVGRGWGGGGHGAEYTTARKLSVCWNFRTIHGG
jgi:hypothetical protein